MQIEKEVGRPETTVPSASGGCGATARRRRRGVPLAVGAATALLAAAAYAAGWVQETGLLFILVGFVAYLRATLGGLG